MVSFSHEETQRECNTGETRSAASRRVFTGCADIKGDGEALKFVVGAFGTARHGREFQTCGGICPIRAQLDSIGRTVAAPSGHECMGPVNVSRLLIVEDHQWVLHRLCSTLRSGGAHIESATTLRAAKTRVCEDDPFDAIVCEQRLSDGTGLELLGWLRWQQHIPVPFLLVTRNPSLTAAYAEDFSVLRPPLRPDRLLASLKSLLHHQAQGVIACQIPFAGELDKTLCPKCLH
jgi:CheY-like chemotaxis protein